MQASKEYVTMPKSGAKINKIDRYGWKEIGSQGEFYLIDKKELFVDHRYQRSNINKKRISDFAANWSWIRCGSLSVCIRDNEWYVVDGQHRKLAADLRSDIKKLPCLVFELGNIPQEASAFVDINNNKSSVSSCDRFKALIVAGDETAVGLNNLMQTTGHKAGNNSGVVKTIACLMTVWNLYKSNKKLLTELWPLISDVHQDCGITDSVVRSIYLTEVLARKVGLSLLNNPYYAFLIKIGGQFIAAEIKKEKTINGLGGSRIETNALIKLLNKQRGHAKLKLVE